MPASSSRLGRKIHRESTGSRTPACTTCKQRRVRCDGQKPACSACTKYNRAGQSCVYRADLYLQRQKEEEERARRGEEGAVEALHSHEEQTPVPEDGASSDIQVDEQMPTSETAAPEYSPPAAPFVPSADGYFGILHPRSSSLSSSCSSSTRDSLSLCNTQPSSPAFSASDLSVDWDLLSLSSCSSWPSPSTPWLLGGCARPHSLLRLTNYPPVPYPAPQPPAAAEQGAINPHWTEATSPLSIPPLELEGMSLWDHHHQQQQPTACGAGDAMQAFAAQRDDTPMPGSMEQTLTLPMVPAFAGDWPAAGQ
ncbi:hypothetical protein Rhopal_005848-T1 [Rhodotorula paludigena]|uniref:Zn(2)-C6 fungal-type domain-containing protein n=1 Tax=Rhodotorula paludigena TaxID=86838 RepID=A0AAV5GJM4_9BASI|nr:hypothetical protein Rhopal_005848-T1 [Rhodotorula paludigena]